MLEKSETAEAADSTDGLIVKGIALSIHKVFI